jgi:group I intron endonuclease
MKGIYKITNLINQKVYIGQSDRLKSREREHFYRLERKEHNNEHLQRAYDKYGRDNFIFECIEETDDLSNRELFWINEYGGINSELNYNLKDPLTMKWSNYTRVKQSKSIMGEKNPNFGRTWTQKQKDEASKKKKGVSLEKRIGKEKADLAKINMGKGQLGRKHPQKVKDKIRKANEGENNPAYGMGERQAGDKNHMFGKPSVKRKLVQQFTKEGVLVKEYDYLSQVAEYGFHIGNVGSVCNGKLKSASGFNWKFKE